MLIRGLNLQNLLKLIEKMINLRLKGSLTIHFDGLGGFKIKSEFGDESTYKLLRDK